jgi:chloride channel protein, CIC family
MRSRITSSTATNSPPARSPRQCRSLLALAPLALLAGALSGAVVGIFRLALGKAEQFRGALIVWAHLHGFPVAFMVVILCAVACAIAARITRRFSPYLAGSGIAHIEAVLDEDEPPAPLGLVPLKFAGGLLAIGSGLALGPEGPAVQMGASTAYFIGRLFRRAWPDNRVLLAAGAGAGLAAVFNAPIAGGVFVLEELVKRFETRIAIAALGASWAAIWIGRMLIGDAPDFQVAPLHYARPGTGLLFLGFGIAMGFAGIVYNRTLLGTLHFGDQIRTWPVEVRAGVTGGGAGLLALFLPHFVGSGESLAQQVLNGGFPLWILLLGFVLRLGLGAVSYAAGTPGGLLAPILALGALSGEAAGYVCRLGFPGLALQPEAFAVVGMAALMTAVSRTPLTSIVLVLEMTGSPSMFLPMLGSCFGAMIVSTALGNPPLYDSLRERVLAKTATDGSRINYGTQRTIPD